jgi:hypothetical protein
MKRILFSVALSLSIGTLFAQDMDKAKLMLQLKKYEDAKKEIDGYLANEKNAKKADGWYTKAQVYLGMSYDDKAKSLVADPVAVAIDAYKKYVEMDPATKAMKEENYPMTDYISQTLFSKAGGLFNAKQYADALKAFKDCVNFGDFAKSKGLMKTGLDTASVFYGAVSASELKNNDESFPMYKMLVDAGVKEYGGNNLGFAYESVVEYYLNKGDEANFNKYLPLARAVAPKSAFLKDADLAFILKAPDMDSKLKKLEAKMNEGTKDERIYTLYNSEIFNFLNADSGKAAGANLGMYETKMMDGANRSLQVFPAKGNPMYYVAAHHYNKLIFATDAITELKKKKPVDAKAVAAKQKDYDDAVDKAIVAYEKAKAAFEQNPDRQGEEKSNYKKTAQRLSDLYYEKTQKASVKKVPAELKKYTDLLNKADALYKSLK